MYNSYFVLFFVAHVPSSKEQSGSSKKDGGFPGTGGGGGGGAGQGSSGDQDWLFSNFTFRRFYETAHFSKK